MTPRRRLKKKFIVLRAATAEEHADIFAVAKTSEYTRDFSNRVMFSSDEAYERGWIRVAEVDGRIVGFTCVRHAKRWPETVLYFVTVLPEFRSLGLGEKMLDDVMAHGPHTKMRLNVMKANEGARRFYERLGFLIAGFSLGGEALSLEREWPAK